MNPRASKPRRTEGHVPRKRFGQNFLMDSGMIRAIVSAIAPKAEDTMVEIGPGLGALTDPLLRHLRRLHVVEIDRELIARLKSRDDSERLILHAGDALAFDFGQLAEGDRRMRIVGNLPYNISTPLLFHLSRFADRVSDMHFMLQKEVVDRMAAAPGSTVYGRLSVMLQYRFDVEKLLDVPPECFDPPPKVDSALVRLIPRARAELTAVNTDDFSRVVAQAFGQRRKMLRSVLKPLFSESMLEALGISPALRAESLPVSDFARLANALSQRGGSRTNP